MPCIIAGFLSECNTPARILPTETSYLVYCTPICVSYEISSISVAVAFEQVCQLWFAVATERLSSRSVSLEPRKLVTTAREDVGRRKNAILHVFSFI